MCVNSLMIKALCIEGNSDSHYRSVPVKNQYLLAPLLTVIVSNFIDHKLTTKYEYIYENSGLGL